MITIRPGSRVRKLIILLSVAGEFPVHSLGLIGKERDLKKLVHRLEQTQDYRSERHGQVYMTKLLQVSGKRNERTVRLYKSALPILDELHHDALNYYMATFWGHRFPGDDFHVWRNHRIGEALALSMAAGVDIRAYALPELQNNAILQCVPKTPSFYPSRDFKKLDVSEFNKTMFTRVIGMLFYSGGAYALYNTRDAVMKWSGLGECKAALHLRELARMNAGLDDMASALLFGSGPEIAMQTLLESDKSRKSELRFDRIYTSVHFIPLDENGKRLLRLLILPNWRERMLGLLFSEQTRPHGYGFMEYDAFVEGVYVYSHLDSDIEEQKVQSDSYPSYL